jgi:hypothetical protein
VTFIALEGCDGAGKTTLGDAIEETLREEYPRDEIVRLHFSQLDQDPIDEYALAFEDYRPGAGKHIIADRLHWGETIYGPLYRDESALTPEAFRWVEMFLAARGATVWHVTAGLETIENRLRVRGEDYLQSHDVKRVWTEFQDVAKRSLLNGGDAFTDQRDAYELASLVIAQAKWTEDRAELLFRPEYIGRNLPHVLLVGDVKGNAEPGVTAAPFIARGQSSGKFLLGALPESWWHGVGIVNANETDIPTLLEALFDPPVVALGMNASEALSELDIDHGIVPHPQKIRRFHNKEKSRYGSLIRQVSLEGGNKLTWPK